MGELALIDWAVCLAYLSVVVGLAIWSMRGQRDNDDYYLGGRRMNWLAVGVSMFATSFSAVSFLGLPQRGAYQDLSFYLVILGIPLIITPILWWLFVPMYVRLGVGSGYEYLGLRFSGPVRRLGSVLYACYALGWMGTMLHGVALTLQAVLGLDEGGYFWMLLGIGAFATAYTAVGGFRAVVWTDVLQAVTLGGAVVVVLLLAVGRIEGGWAGFWQIASDGGRLRMFHLNTADPLAADNFTEPSSLYTALAFALFMYLPGYTVAQNMIQRYVCCGSTARGRGVVALSAAVNAGLGLLFMLVGVVLYGFYSQPGGGGLPEVGVEIAREDQILPYFVSRQAAGIGLVGLLLAGLFAAAMSTMDSGINGMASVIAYDWLGGRRLPIGASRALTVLLGALVIGAALLAPRLGPTVLDIVGVIAGTFLGLILAAFLLGMLVPRANSGGVLIGLLAGAVCLLAVWRFTDIPQWWLGAFAILPTFFIGAAASFLFPRPAAAALAGTVYRGRPAGGKEA